MWLQKQGKKPSVLPNQSHSWCYRLLLLMDVTLLVFFARCGQNWYLILKEKKVRQSIRICDTPLVYLNPWGNRRKNEALIIKRESSNMRHFDNSSIPVFTHYGVYSTNILFLVWYWKSVWIWKKQDILSYDCITKNIWTALTVRSSLHTWRCYEIVYATTFLCTIVHFFWEEYS